MKIGIARETAPGETRVALLPEEVKKLTAAKHAVFVQKNAGAGIFIKDTEYKKAGANIADDPKDIFDKDIVVKLKAPREEEFDLLKTPKKNILVSMFHPQQNPWNIVLERASNTIVIALEMLANEHGERLINCNRMTGQQGMLLALQQSIKTPQECGILMLGYGEVATGAMQAAFGLGADIKIARRNELKDIGYFIKDRDLLVNALKWPEEKRRKKEYLVTRKMLALLAPGAIVLDLSVDHPGPIETCRATSVKDPFYFEEGVKHICIYGYPALSPLSSARRYSRQILPIVLEIANKGLAKASKEIKKAVVR
ncbi:MAG: hypothetical protein KKH83_06910 [Candidatus Margulisbacteria bacterium]|nr:hypothetical protein [Candidatus Margulisiibacteriota bacterium]